MKSNRNLLILAFAILLGACTEEKKDDKKGLSTSLINNPRTADAGDPELMSKMPTMDFVDTTHDFGSMHAGEVSGYDFHFTNNGKQPLLISSAVGSCGCTVPEYPHEPIAPGKSGVVHVQFNSQGKIGHQNKTVSLQTNSSKGVHLLVITAEVAEGPQADK